ncbi:MAG: SpoIIIAH-like family protein [Desulfosporosinus sp.]|jgi:stage III sporulation protein AH
MFNKQRKQLAMRRHIKIWFGGLVVLAVILAVIGSWVKKIEPPIYFSVQSGLPVSAVIENTPLQFEVETINQNISGENYFVNYRLKREQYRQETKAMLLELLNAAEDKNMGQAQKNWLELSMKILKEGEIENLLNMKGFQDAVADVSSENVTVIVYASDLTPHEVSMIQDIVVRTTNVRLDKIVISTRD